MSAEFTLILVMRFLGVSALFAIPAIVMPFSWMEQIHEFIGFGELPDRPIVRYLARSLSAFYAMFGAIAVWMSFDLPRYAPLIRLWGTMIAVMGVVLVGIGLDAGMATWWLMIEGPFTITAGVVVIVLNRRIHLQPTRQDATEPAWSAGN